MPAEPRHGELAKRESDDGAQPAFPQADPPALRKLWAGIRWIYILNMLVVFGTFSQAYLACRANELTRGALRQAREQSAAALSQSESATAAAIEQNERLTGESLRLTVDGLRESRESTRAALEAVKAAREANEANARLFEADQRPWLLIHQITLQDIKAEDTEARAELVIANLGKTPAMSVAFDAEMVVRGTGEGFPPSRPRITRIIGPSGQAVAVQPLYGDSDIMGPSVRRSIGFRAALRSKDHEELQRQTRHVYVYGHITYTDIFGKQRATHFCYLSEAPDLSSTRRTEYRVRACSFGNRVE
jgi:hypothetical protein